MKWTKFYIFPSGENIKYFGPLKKYKLFIHKHYISSFMQTKKATKNVPIRSHSKVQTNNIRTNTNGMNQNHQTIGTQPRHQQRQQPYTGSISNMSWEGGPYLEKKIKKNWTLNIEFWPPKKKKRKSNSRSQKLKIQIHMHI